MHVLGDTPSLRASPLRHFEHRLPGKALGGNGQRFIYTLGRLFGNCGYLKPEAYKKSHTKKAQVERPGAFSSLSSAPASFELEAVMPGL